MRNPELPVSAGRHGGRCGATSLTVQQTAIAVLGCLWVTAAAAGPLSDLAFADASTATQANVTDGGGLGLRRQVIGSGGGTSSGGAFDISGTIGQADAEPLQPSTGGTYAVTGGFWPGIDAAAPVGDSIFADGFE